LKQTGWYRAIGYLIALVWLLNGLYCKLLNYVPRHEEIVSRILGDEHSRLLTILIGVSEILMAIWILSGIKPKLSAIAQIVIVASMNIIEYFVAPDLLLWGKVNALFAVAFIGIVYYREFVLGRLTTELAR
jgi:uncharacterized membrane protein YphA (DoxX/SURF4 family)